MGSSGMTDISLRQQSSHEPLFDTDRLVSNLYESCLQLFLCLIKAQDCDASAIRRLRYRAQEFRLWGTTFDAHEGALDESIIDVPRLKRVLLPMLSGLGETLVNLSCRFHQDEMLVNLHAEVFVLKNQVSNIMDEFTWGGGHKPSEQPNTFFDEFSSEYSSSSINEVEELLQDVQSYNSCLYELGDAVLKDSKEKLDVKKNQMHDITNQDSSNNSALPYIANIIDEYPSIDKVFARRLGEANHLRYMRLKSRRDSAMARSHTTESSSDELQTSSSVSKVSWGLSNPDSSVPERKTLSTFDNEPRSSEITRHVERPGSVTTFASSAGEGAESSKQLRRGIPKMPSDQPRGTDFSCTICGDRLFNVWSPQQWV